ncbi:type I-E CRISPR-associated protein Cas5/CasD [Streptomyces sp. NPDC004111]|uniref:type I-E CRISPR-associated protein Cas5/CasD n=1 Tax=Streptomyces sp. NPDC004111 TaxID=3364690 RepID=UPI0036A588FE
MSMSGGHLLRLAGPLSSWGLHAAFHDRDTAPHPTRSALIGMLAAASGLPREHALAPHHDLPGTPTFQDLHFTVRTDRPGNLYTDFHTVGGGRPREQQLATSSGAPRPPAAATLVSHRHYLADAAFTVAMTGPRPLLERIAHHLEHPHWAPYLGRRSCPPTEPLVLATHHPNPVHALLHETPLTPAYPPRQGQTTVPVTFHWDQPPPGGAADAEHELPDAPQDFTTTRRRYTTRPTWRTTEHLPASLHAGSDPLATLIDYRLGHQ